MCFFPPNFPRILYVGHGTSPVKIPPYPRNLYVFYTYILRGFGHVGKPTYLGVFSHLQRGFGNTTPRIIYVYYTWDKNIRIICAFMPTYFIRIFAHVFYTYICPRILYVYFPMYYIRLLSHVLYTSFVPRIIYVFCPTYYIRLLSHVLYTSFVPRISYIFFPTYFIRPFFPRINRWANIRIIYVYYTHFAHLLYT